MTIQQKIRNLFQSQHNLDTIDLSEAMPLFYAQRSNDHEASALVLTADHFKNLPTHYVTKQISISKIYHYYNEIYRIELARCSTTAAGYFHLGLLILQAIFQQQQICIELTDSESFIQKIYIMPQPNTHYLLSHSAREWHYVHESMQEFRENQKQFNLKFNFLLSTDQEQFSQDWEKDRKILYFADTIDNLAYLAHFFFNFAHPDNQRDEIDFESDVGFGGIQPGSVEMSFVLPSSIAFGC